MCRKLFLFKFACLIPILVCFQFTDSNIVLSKIPIFDKVSKVDVIYPNVSKNVIFGAEFTTVRIREWLLVFPDEGNLQLAGDLKAEWMTDEDNIRTNENLPECDYKTGTVEVERKTTRAAVSVCGSWLTGYFQIKDHFYFFQPEDDGTTRRHILFKSQNSHSTRRRPVRSAPAQPPDWLFNLTGDTIDILGDESEADIELDHVRRHPSSATDVSSNEKGRNGSTETEIPLEYLRRGSSAEYDEENGYFYDSAWSTFSIHAHRWGGNNLPTRWLEIAVAVDHTLISFHGKDKVQQYVLSLMNIVSAIYQDPSLGANLKLAISRLVLYEHKKHGVVRPGNARKSLENVNIWNRKLHASLKPDQAKHDVAVWLTRSDIGGPSGYAPVAGVCDPKRSCSLNRDEGLTSAFIIAHEMAHILGLNHDGDTKAGNDCDDAGVDGSVMAPMVSSTFSKFSWSECSKREFKNKVSNWGCLTNPPTGKGEILLNTTLQTIFSMDEQCRMEFGDGYYMCRVFDVSEPCSHLWCGHSQNPYVCKTKKGPPLEGTECGFGKWCINGYCSEVTHTLNKIPVVLNPQHGGWSSWGLWGPCSRTCGMGVQYRSRSCDSPKPSYGGRDCEGKAEEWQLCNKGPCKNGFVDLRAEQCKLLPRILKLPGIQITDTWLPYESQEDDQKCKFSCVSDERKEIFTTEENLPDGTPCSYDNEDNICVQGQCQQIGCDGVLNSTITRDSCGVCGGDDSQCIKSNVTTHKILKREISRISVLPKMAKHIKMEADVNGNFLEIPSLAFVLKNRRKKGYVVTIPNKAIHTKIVEGANFFYKKIGSRHKIWGVGPILAEIIIMVVTSQKDIAKGVNISYNTQYSIHREHLMPSKRFVWKMGGWGPCSTSCGGGRRQKTIACWDNQLDKFVRRKFCSLIQKPYQESEVCNGFGCDFQWVPGRWEPCSRTCGREGIQYREVYCVPDSLFDAVSNRSVILAEPWKYMVNPNKCKATKPSDVKPCNRKPCFHYWEFGNWSQCSVSCGIGFATRSAYCSASEDGTCGERPPAQRRVCTASFSHRNNKLCRGRKLKRCKKDDSKYCQFDMLLKYCELRGFRSLCCKSCAEFDSEGDSLTNNYLQEDIQVISYQNMI